MVPAVLYALAFLALVSGLIVGGLSLSIAGTAHWLWRQGERFEALVSGFVALSMAGMAAAVLALAGLLAFIPSLPGALS
jgi:hypothetical protein